MSEQEKQERLIAAIRAKAEEILPEGSQVALYGSRARGDARQDSDWDLHVLVPGDEKLAISKWDEYGWPFEQLGLDFDAWITPRVYSFAGWLKRNFLPFYKNVEKDKIVIFQK
ncbi:MAG: nucleotidyltransferase domain-containing protein [Muribaculaceae bacterium]|nr:nucleotidyltransferase domain-containing protein [Muribaculaceae bacterium]